MKVLVTGGNGMVGSAIIDHLNGLDSYEFIPLDIHPRQSNVRETYKASVADYEAIRPAFDDVDAVIHLAVYSEGINDENWQQIQAVNIDGTRNVLRAVEDANVEQVVFASTNHVVGGYENEHAPALYNENFELNIDHETEVRPDSTYAVSKLFGEHDGRFFIENSEYPEQFYAIRIGALRSPEYDHPYGDAEKLVASGSTIRNSEEYELAVQRLKALWFSRRDCANMVHNVLQDDEGAFEILYGVSDNDRRWLDIEYARDKFDYSPKDNSERWDAPPQ